MLQNQGFVATQLLTYMTNQISLFNTNDHQLQLVITGVLLVFANTYPKLRSSVVFSTKSQFCLTNGVHTVRSDVLTNILKSAILILFPNVLNKFYHSYYFKIAYPALCNKFC